MHALNRAQDITTFVSKMEKNTAAEDGETIMKPVDNTLAHVDGEEEATSNAEGYSKLK